MKLGGLDIGSVYLGTNAVSSVYLGTNLVWSGMDADYQAILDYATTQGYTLPSASQQALQNQLVVDLKDAGIWSKLDTFAVFATDGDSDFALIDWKRLSQYTAFNSPTFTTDFGFNGDGASSYIDTNFDLSNLTTKLITNQESISTGLYIPRDDSATTEYILGNASDANFRLWSGNQTVASNRYMGMRYDGDWSGTGLMSVHRIYNASAANWKVYNNKTDVSVTATNGYSSISGTNILIFRHLSTYNLNDSCSFFYSGDSLVTEISDFVDALDNYYNAL